MKTLWILYCIAGSNLSQTPISDAQELVKFFDTPEQCLSQKSDGCECLQRRPFGELVEGLAIKPVYKED